MASNITKDLQSFLQEIISEIDVELKAACYDITIGQMKNALSIIEKVRRKLMVLQKKSEIYHKEITKEKVEMKRYQDMVASLRKEKKKLQEELSTVSKELQDLQDFESIVSELDTSQPASNDEDEVMVSQPSESV